MVLPRQADHLADRPWSVLWTRGRGCADLADVLGRAVRVSGDLVDACLTVRADLLVSRRMPSLDLVSVAVPHDFDSGRVRQVVAAVSGGPHSTLAAEVARRLSLRLGVPGRLVSAYRTEHDLASARIALRSAARADLPAEAVRADSASALLEQLAEGSLMVLGAPGGSLVQRLFLGPGARLVARAPSGAVVVRRAPERVFRRMGEAVGVSPHMRVSDARRVVADAVVPVVSEGTLLGSFRPSKAQGEDLTVGELMEAAVSVEAIASLSEAASRLADTGGAPLAVVDRRGRLIGRLCSEDLG